MKLYDKIFIDISGQFYSLKSSRYSSPNPPYPPAKLFLDSIDSSVQNVLTDFFKALSLGKESSVFYYFQ